MVLSGRDQLRELPGAYRRRAVIAPESVDFGQAIAEQIVREIEEPS